MMQLKHLAIAMLVSAPCFADTLKIKNIVSVYDGDTIRVNLNCNEPLFCDNMPIRLLGFDTPEIRGECESEKALARQARDRLKALLESAKSITLNEVERGKYFRLLARVEADEQDVGAVLVSEGLARSYDGGKRDGWCVDLSEEEAE